MNTDLLNENNLNPTPFSKDIIFNYHNYLQRNDLYLCAREETKFQSVPLEQVIGIDQMYGDDATWGDCLEGTWLKRIKSNLAELQENPSYYTNEEEKNGLSFIKVEDMYFISTGKHRTIIARFLSHFNPEEFPNSELKNVQVTEYFLDREFIEMKATLTDLAKSYPNLKLEVSHTVDRDDLSFLTVSEKGRFGQFECFSRNQYSDVIEGLTRPTVRKKFNSEKRIYEPSIYSFISYMQCFRTLLNRTPMS